MAGNKRRGIRKPPFDHREIARALIEAKRIQRRLEGKPEIVWMPDWLKVEIYNLIMTALPQLFTALIWMLIFAAIYWWLLP